MLARFWWLVQKDLMSEYRARRAWPAMLVFGMAVALMFGVQMELLPKQKPLLVGGLLWLATFFAGMLAVDRSFASEREQGCWDALFQYPVAPTAVFAAKLTVNIASLAMLQCVLIPLIIVLSDVALLTHPGPMLLIAILGNVGISAVGTLLSAMTARMRQGGNLLALLVLPMSIPVVLAAAEATTLISQGDFSPAAWRWIQLLGAFDILFITAGVVLFEYVIED